MRVWKLEDAKNQFSRLVRIARTDGPQIVTRHGQEEVVVMAMDDYRRLTRSPKGIVAFMRESPMAEALAEDELKLMRTRDLPREIEL